MVASWLHGLQSDGCPHGALNVVLPEGHCVLSETTLQIIWPCVGRIYYEGSTRNLLRLVGGQLTLNMGCCMGVTPVTRAWLGIVPEVSIHHSSCCLAGWSAAVFPEDEGGHAAGKGSIAGH